MIQLTRKEAEAKINNHWAAAKAECLKAKAVFHDYSIDRKRNYEIEFDLKEIFGEEHLINEWCPFNGIYSGWANYCPITFLEETLKDMIAECKAPAHIEYLEKKIAERKTNG